MQGWLGTLSSGIQVVSRFSLHSQGADQWEDCLASSHGGSSCLFAGPVLLDECVWAAYVGMPRRYASVVGPCEEAMARVPARTRIV